MWCCRRSLLGIQEAFVLRLGDIQRPDVEKPSYLRSWAFVFLAPRPGLEPGTCGLTVRF